MSLTIIAIYSLPHEAHIAKASLEGAGIPAFIYDEHTVNMNWLYSNAVGGVKLLVAQAHVDEANKILATDYSDELEEALDIKESLTCARCSSHDISPFIKGRRITWLMILLLCLPYFFYKKGFKCNACGYFWQA